MKKTRLVAHPNVALLLVAGHAWWGVPTTAAFVATPKARPVSVGHGKPWSYYSNNNNNNSSNNNKSPASLLQSSFSKPTTLITSLPRGTPTRLYGISSAAATSVSSSWFSWSLSSLPPMTTIMGVVYMILLALQFAIQPILTRTYASSRDLNKLQYVLAQEVVRLTIGLTWLVLTGSFTVATTGWSLPGSAAAVGVPALLYLLQNYCSLTAYQTLPPLTYNVLNQTKTLSAAVCCWWLLRQSQSPRQMVALVILLLSALVMESLVRLPFLGNAAKAADKPVPNKEEKKHTGTMDTDTRRHYVLFGIVPVLTASMTSGLAGAWTQKSLKARNSLLFSVELAACSIAILMVRFGLAYIMGRKKGDTNTDDSSKVSSSWRQGWTWQTWIPVLTNSSGGILVGLVTKYEGAVRKGFALIFGMFLSGLLQNVWADRQQDTASSTSDDLTTTTTKPRRVTAQQWVGGVLAAVSLWMHSTKR